jgi:hypothetical protein
MAYQLTKGTKMQYLFIGGSRDGQRMAVEKDTVNIPVTENDHAVYGELKSTVGIKWEQYRSFRIRGEACEFVVYALVELSPDDILRTLLAKYQAWYG